MKRSRVESRSVRAGTGALAGGARLGRHGGWPSHGAYWDGHEWRLAWAAAHVLIGLPLNMFFLPKVGRQAAEAAASEKPDIPLDRTMVLAVAFACAWAVTGAMAAHLPGTLESVGATSIQAVAASAFIGPAQVLARIAGASLVCRFHPIVSTRIACVTRSIEAAVMALVGGPAAIAFAIFHGTGNDILTIARGTLPLAIFGPKDYGYRLGILGAPARIAQAAAPLVFSVLIDQLGGRVMLVSSALSVVALVALSMVRCRDRLPGALPARSS